LRPPEVTVWGPRDIVFAIAVALAAGFVLVNLIVTPVALVVGSTDDPAALTAGLFATILFDVALVSSAVFFSVVRYRLSWHALGLRTPSANQLWLGVGTAVAAQVTVATYGVLVQLLGLDKLVPGTNVPEKLFEQPLVLPLVGVATVLVAPFAEETFFRGFVFGGLRRYGFFWAALASGLMFSVAHLNPGGLLPLTLVGMLFAWAYNRTGTLWTNVTAHLTFNLVSFIALTATAIVQIGGSR
jgi:hypothetical protein